MIAHIATLGSTSGAARSKFMPRTPAPRRWASHWLTGQIMRMPSAAPPSAIPMSATDGRAKAKMSEATPRAAAQRQSA